jgi:hypothetical protein
MAGASSSHSQARRPEARAVGWCGFGLWLVDMENATLWIAVAGVLLGGLSLGWQAATHFLTGGRAVVTAEVWAENERTGSQVVTRVRDFALDDLGRWDGEGFTWRTLVVEVRSVGRMPFTVTGLEFSTPYGRSFEVMDVRGPTMPHSMDVGGLPGTWIVSFDAVRDLVDRAKGMGARVAYVPAILETVFPWLNRMARLRRVRRGAVVVVSLGDGRQVTGAGGLRL